MKKNIGLFILAVFIMSGLVFLHQHINRYARENKILKQVISRLEADSRIAEVLVTNVSFDEKTKKFIITKNSTPISFPEKLDLHSFCILQ